MTPLLLDGGEICRSTREIHHFELCLFDEVVYTLCLEIRYGIQHYVDFLSIPCYCARTDLVVTSLVKRSMTSIAKNSGSSETTPSGVTPFECRKHIKF